MAFQGRASTATVPMRMIGGMPSTASIVPKTGAQWLTCGSRTVGLLGGTLP